MRSRASQPNKPAVLDASHYNAVVLWATGGVYRILLDNQKQVDASLRGRLKIEERTSRGDLDRVVAGDRVRANTQDDGSYVIEAVAARKSELLRRAPGRNSQRAKVLVANVDQVVIVVAVARPEPHLRMLDRMLVLAESNDLPALIVVNKMDLVAGDFARSLFQDYSAAGYEVLFSSVKQGVALAEIRELVCGRESVVTGPSGVGKSSLLNELQPGSELRTGAISEVVAKGRHTTVAARLIPLDCGGFIVDTPGMREVGLWAIDPENLDVCFPEFRDMIGECRFTTSCTHTHEPDCAIRDAAQSGTISRDRYESYAHLYQEAREAEKQY